jgi:transposase-like protein
MKDSNPSDLTELPIGCPDCGGKLRAGVGPADAEVPPSHWVCPYCNKQHSTDFGGKLFFVVKRFQPATLA